VPRDWSSDVIYHTEEDSRHETGSPDVIYHAEEDSRHAAGSTDRDTVQL